MWDPSLLVYCGHRFFTAKQYSSFNTLGRHFNVTRNDGSLLATTKLVNSQKSCSSFDPGRSPRVTDWVKRSSKSWSSMTTGWWLGYPHDLGKPLNIYIYIYICVCVSFPIYSKKLSYNVLKTKCHKPPVITITRQPSHLNRNMSRRATASATGLRLSGGTECRGAARECRKYSVDIIGNNY